MSFFVYYGELDDELLVAVLPNGTVEHNDPIYLYTKKWNLTTHKATDVKVTDEGEDLINFKDNHYTYQVVTKRAYKELALSVKGSDGKTSKVALTRHYDQPLTTLSASDPPKIWIGSLDFHQWAKNEAFFVITPKGLGNGKPVVSIWQWTKDAEKGERSLTYSTSQQQSQTTTPAIFSFKQNGYYTLDCRVNTKTNGLNVTVKEKTNQDAPQKEMTLAQKVLIGAEHQFSPPRATTEKITMDCSYPKATSSLKRYNGALPFPADLVETLRHSAAYVDQAGYLAQHAVNQYNQLDKSFLMLEKKAEARAARIVVLEGDVAKHLEANRVLEAKNKALQKQFDDYRAAAEKREADLEAELQALKKRLDAAEAEVKRQKDYIEKDKKADEKRDKEFNDHDQKDHELINKLKAELAESKAAEDRAQRRIKDLDATVAKLKETIKKLEKDVCDKDTIIAELKASLASTKEQLSAKIKEVAKLTKELDTITAAKEKLEIDLSNEKYRHNKAKESLQVAQKDLADKDEELKSKKTDVKNLQDKLNTAEAALKRARAERDEARADLVVEEKKSQKAEDDLEEEQKKTLQLGEKKDAKIKELEDRLAKADSEHGEHHSLTKGDVKIISHEIVGA